MVVEKHLVLAVIAIILIAIGIAIAFMLPPAPMIPFGIDKDLAEALTSTAALACAVDVVGTNSIDVSNCEKTYTSHDFGLGTEAGRFIEVLGTKFVECRREAITEDKAVFLCENIQFKVRNTVRCEKDGDNWKCDVDVFSLPQSFFPTGLASRMLELIVWRGVEKVHDIPILGGFAKFIGSSFFDAIVLPQAEKSLHFWFNFIQEPKFLIYYGYFPPVMEKYFHRTTTSTLVSLISQEVFWNTVANIGMYGIGKAWGYAARKLGKGTTQIVEEVVSETIEEAVEESGEKTAKELVEETIEGGKTKYFERLKDECGGDEKAAKELFEKTEKEFEKKLLEAIVTSRKFVNKVGRGITKSYKKAIQELLSEMEEKGIETSATKSLKGRVKAAFENRFSLDKLNAIAKSQGYNSWDELMDDWEDDIIYALLHKIKDGSAEYVGGKLTEEEVKRTLKQTSPFPRDIDINWDELWKNEFKGSTWVKTLQNEWAEDSYIYKFAKGKYKELDNIRPGLSEDIKKSIREEFENFWKNERLNMVKPSFLTGEVEALSKADETIENLHKIWKQFEKNPYYSKYGRMLRAEDEVVADVAFSLTDASLRKKVIMDDEVWGRLGLRDKLRIMYKYYWESGAMKENIRNTARGYLKRMGMSTQGIITNAPIMGKLIGDIILRKYLGRLNLKYHLCGSNSLCLYIPFFFSPKSIFNFTLQTDKFVVSKINTVTGGVTPHEYVRAYATSPCFSTIHVEKQNIRLKCMSEDEIHATVFIPLKKEDICNPPDEYYVSVVKIDETQRKVKYLDLGGFEFKNMPINPMWCMNLTGDNHEEIYANYYDCAEGVVTREMWNRLSGTEEDKMYKIYDLFVNQGYTLSITRQPAETWEFTYETITSCEEGYNCTMTGCGEATCTCVCYADTYCTGSNSYRGKEIDWCFIGNNTVKEYKDIKIENWKEKCEIKRKDGTVIGRLPPFSCLNLHIRNEMETEIKNKCGGNWKEVMDKLVFYGMTSIPLNIRTNEITGMPEVYRECVRRKPWYGLGFLVEGENHDVVVLSYTTSDLKEKWDMQKGTSLQFNYCWLNKATKEDWNQFKCQMTVLAGEIVVGVVTGGSWFAAKVGRITAFIVSSGLDYGLGGLEAVCQWVFQPERMWPSNQW